VKGLTCETRPVRPGTEAYLEKARQGLSNAHAKLGIRLANDAGRNAYLAVFHAAQALIFGHSRKVIGVCRANFTDWHPSARFSQSPIRLKASSSVGPLAICKRVRKRALRDGST